MKSLLKKSFVAIGIVAFLGGQIAYCAVDPDAVPIVSNLPILDSKTGTGPDGNIRVLWDINPGTTTYTGSVLWILDNLGNFLAAGNPSIPAGVGYVGRGAKSHILVQGQADGNTTLVFPLGPYSQSPSTTTEFAVWTYNSAGQLIAAVVYGPYNGWVVEDIRFSPTGDFTVVWTDGSAPAYGGSTGAVVAWTLNEFGSIATGTPSFGPYGNTFLGKVDLDQNNLQHWYWTTTASGLTTLTLWGFNGAGQIASSNAFGPFN